MLSTLDETVKEFLVESFENMDQLDRDLVALEKDPGSREILARIFRTIHTIKGTCGFLAFSRLESVTHVGENLLCRLRDGNLVLTPDITSVLLAMVDAVRRMLNLIESTGQDDDGQTDYSDLVSRITIAAGFAEERAHPIAEAEPAAMPAPSIVPPAPVGLPSVKKEAKPEREPSSKKEPAAPPAGDAVSVTESTIRVDVGLLDRLMNLVGELVLARNQILQHASSSLDPNLLATTQRLNLITSELQEGVMKTRMQPIGNIWSKFPRIVRDLAITCGKQVQIEMTGKETELDKTIIEAIKDPLTHVIRNAVDHGIENPERRLLAGKPAAGNLRLRAFHEGGQVNIEISDDGAGIDPERVKQKALQRGLLTPDQAVRFSDRDAISLIFLPGFSTAEKVSNISGRGVGMDVVKTNVERIGGSIDVQSRVGQGSNFKIKIPLTLAIIPALIVSCGGDRFAIPQVSLVELVRLEAGGERMRKAIEYIHGAPVYRLRGNLLPLLHLHKELGLPAQGAPDVLNIVVLQAGARQFGLVVDAISDTEEIVVKPLSKLLKGIPCFAGATIMGDGKVALILDVLGIAERANVIAEGRDRALERKSEGGPSVEGTQTLLLLEGEKNARMAIPLSLVARLEEIQRKSVERAGDTEVIQYRDEILPLVYLKDVLPSAQGGTEGRATPQVDEESPLRVVVYRSGEGNVGLVVQQILDIVEENIKVKLPSRRKGVLSSAVVQGRVTDLLDVDVLIRSALPKVIYKESVEMEMR